MATSTEVAMTATSVLRRQSQSRNAEATLAAVAAWNAGDLDGYLSLYDDVIRLHGYAPEPMDKTAVTGFYRSVFDTLRAEDGKGPRLEFLDILEDGDRIANRFVMSGHHVGPFMGIPPTGRPYVLNGITILRFTSGLVVERWSSADMLGLLMQIGALPPPAQN
jgi:predicted ester cyclase